MATAIFHQTAVSRETITSYNGLYLYLKTPARGVSCIRQCSQKSQFQLPHARTWEESHTLWRPTCLQEVCLQINIDSSKLCRMTDYIY